MKRATIKVLLLGTVIFATLKSNDRVDAGVVIIPIAHPKCTFGIDGYDVDTQQLGYAVANTEEEAYSEAMQRLFQSIENISNDDTGDVGFNLPGYRLTCVFVKWESMAVFRRNSLSPGGVPQVSVGVRVDVRFTYELVDSFSPDSGLEDPWQVEILSP